MDITIFGGTGKTGLLVIQKMLDKGHSVTAYARAPSKIPFQHHRLKIVKGELTGKKNRKKKISLIDFQC